MMAEKDSVDTGAPRGERVVGRGEAPSVVPADCVVLMKLARKLALQKAPVATGGFSPFSPTGPRQPDVKSRARPEGARRPHAAAEQLGQVLDNRQPQAG